MRHVDLRWEQEQSPATQKVAGHLNARMEELREDGLAVHFVPARGEVGIRFPRRDAALCGEQLARGGVLAERAEETILFYVGAGVSFEDMDYVQGLVMDLLYAD